MSETCLRVRQQMPSLSESAACHLRSVLERRKLLSTHISGPRLVNGFILWGPLRPFASLPPGAAAGPHPFATSSAPSSGVLQASLPPRETRPTLKSQAWSSPRTPKLFEAFQILSTQRHVVCLCHLTSEVAQGVQPGCQNPHSPTPGWPKPRALLLSGTLEY